MRCANAPESVNQLQDLRARRGKIAIISVKIAPRRPRCSGSVACAACCSTMMAARLAAWCAALSATAATAAAADAAASEGWKFLGWYPNHYVAQQLGPSERIAVDGKLVRPALHGWAANQPIHRTRPACPRCGAPLTDNAELPPHNTWAQLSQDEAEWAAVPSLSEGFVDITHHENDQLNAVPPHLQAKVKVRWDKDFVYVGAELQEPWIHAAPTQTQHNGPVPPYLGALRCQHPRLTTAARALYAN